MKRRDISKPPQFSLILRLLCGGYLIYLAYGLLEAIHENPLYIAAIAVFALVGLALIVHSVVKLRRGEYTRANTAADSDNSKDCEVQTDEQ